MRVFKFGGASVKDAEAIKNMATILQDEAHRPLIVVVSAMGKMTNKFEELLRAWIDKTNVYEVFEQVKSFHNEVADGLDLQDRTRMEKLYGKIDELLNTEPPQDSNLAYDQLVSFGELLSTTIIESYFHQIEMKVEWFDARNVIITDNNHRSASVDWSKSAKRAEVLINHLREDDPGIILTQGFIGNSFLGNTTTLGREGSDFSAGIFAYLCDAEDVTFWKDVPGMLNADPKWFNNTQKLDKISFREAIELSYYGASVFHPKTIKPLKNKSIPLYVKSFLDPKSEGTCIQESIDFDQDIPSYIFKADQMLVSISPRDFSFIAEENLRDIFEVLAELGITINLMQNSAVNFSIVVDGDHQKFKPLYDLLSHDYEVKYNEGLQLLTVRHYKESIIKELAGGKEVLLDQRSRNTARLVLR